MHVLVKLPHYEEYLAFDENDLPGDALTFIRLLSTARRARWSYAKNQFELTNRGTDLRFEAITYTPTEEGEPLDGI